MKRTELLIILTLFSIQAFAMSPKMERAYKNRQQSKFLTEMKNREDFQQECLNNKKFIDFDYNVQCETNYHHYNSNGFKNYYSRSYALRQGEVRISEFNVLHPGMSKTRYKDYRKVAQMMEQYDVIGVTELIPLMGTDYTVNQSLMEFIETAPDIIDQLEAEIASLKRSIAASTRGATVKKRNLTLKERRLQQMQEDLEDASSLYRKPGYIKILDELQALEKDDSHTWALILSPRGEGPETSNTKELVGYYYRSSVVKPQVNKYCKNSRYWGRATPYACIINLDADDMGDDKSGAFSRRPFLAEFISGNFSFALLTSHVLFQSPTDEDLMRYIMRKAFGVSTYVGFGTGMAKDNYARFAEVKMSLEFIERNLKGSGHQKDIIYMGDLNLESANQFWPNVLSAWPGAQLFIDGKTSVTKTKYDKHGDPTFGKASNYDHFIFDPKVTDECILSENANGSAILDGGVYDFTRGKIGGLIKRGYRVRIDYSKDGEKDDMEFFPAQYDYDEYKYERLVEKHATPKTDGTDPFLIIGKKNATYGKHQLTSRGIIEDTKANNKYAKYFMKRVLDTQLNDKTYYTYYEQLLSDHYPIYMNCSNQ